MRKIIITCAILIATSFNAFAQVGVGTTTPQGALDVVSSDSGVVVPRVANTAAVTAPVNGMIIYDLSENCFKGYRDGEWSGCGFAPSASTTVLTQIGNEADSPDSVNSVVTVAQLNQIFPALTAVDVSRETDYQNYIDAYPDDFASPATQAEVQAMVTELNNLASNNLVISPTGKIWMDRNLGATQVATSSTDAASYGDLYQWGRNSDGHESSTSTVTAGPVVSGSEGSNFITINAAPNDWLSTQDDTRWDVPKTANDPCPTGYRVPTETELDAERTLFATSNDAGAFASVLKLPVAGYRNYSTGALASVGSSGRYWSSTVSGTSARRLYFGSSAANMSSSNRAYGFSVRCLKE